MLLTRFRTWSLIQRVGIGKLKQNVEVRIERKSVNQPQKFFVKLESESEGTSENFFRIRNLRTRFRAWSSDRVYREPRFQASGAS